MTSAVDRLMSKFGTNFAQNSNFHICMTILCQLRDSVTPALRKAFEVVDREILLNKLKSHKFDDRTIDWIKSYLTNRRQCIVDKTANSSFQQVISGVPQDLVLSPVLFLIFINDMPLYINEAYAEIYADDTNVHTSDIDQIVVQVKLQNSSTDFKCWCIIHKLFVNLTKTSSMSIGSRQNLSNNDDFYYN